MMIDPNPELRVMTLPACPVTAGVPTRMTPRGFKEACERVQKLILDSTKVIPPCFRCAGQPTELELIKLEDFTMTKALPKTTKGTTLKRKNIESGKCKLCNERTATVVGYGHHVCATCRKIFADISKRNELIDKARVMLGVAGSPAITSDAEELAEQDMLITTIVTVLNSNGADLVDVAKARMETIDTLQAAITDRENKILILRETVDTLRATVDTVSTSGERENSVNTNLARRLAMIQAIITPAHDPQAEPHEWVGEITSMATEIAIANGPAV